MSYKLQAASCKLQAPGKPAVGYSLLLTCGLWLVACGLWLVACGLWLVACGLWLVACGLGWI
ncbi:hypothetical protein EF096_08290 [Pseudomonas neustonica]|uniref:Uncharacterized protein n=1 Tax=Pseudomonas neustonica TaxID=2487346 RepID=A0ABX9XJ06_9PSED|nr:hypothetical protein EF099_09430 [Pseudomonas sp. SSM44]ROZ85424.1 hypothetical protein EF096_08290 [Pseudomonas neustonica]